MRRRLAATIAVALTVVVTVAGQARGQQDTGWRIREFAVDLTLRVDGTLDVVERLTVDFGGLERRGIFRDIPVRYEVPPDPPYELPEGLGPDDLRRAIDIDRIEVLSPSAPTDLEITRPGPVDGDNLRIRIGDPERTITGEHRYVITYRVEGVLTAPRGTPELFWNAVGAGWPVPIDAAAVVVDGAGEPTESTCFRGQVGSVDPCAVTELTRFAAQELAPGEAMTVAVDYRAGSVPVPPPILLERWSLQRAFVGSPWSIPLTALTAVLGFGGVALLAFRQGRDRLTARGVTVDGRVAPTAGGGPDRRRRLFEPRTVAVRYRPPQDLRPAQLGLIVDESVDPVDVSATVVDLAVRGHLRIEQEDQKRFGLFTSTDWRLVRTDPAEREDAPPDDDLMAYERMLLDGLFADGDSVLLSDLKGSFATTYGKVQRAIYNNGQKRRWFAKRPDKARSQWLGVGIAALIVAMGLLVAAVLFTTVALAIVPVVLAALALAIAHRWMPHRTGVGSRLLDETLGFREFVVTAEADRMAFAERERIFAAYLPYAVVFGAVEHWASTFADLGVGTEAVAGWYVSPHPFNFYVFGAGMRDLSTSMAATLPQAPASSGGSGGFGGSGFGGGGFSGGGFGGGGGGSW